MGVKGVLPLGCLPLWGKEGVTLIAAAEINLVMGKKNFCKNKKLNFFISQFREHFLCDFSLVITNQFRRLK